MPDMATCERHLADMEIIEGPELAIFGTKLDIDAECFSPIAAVYHGPASYRP